MMFTRASLRLTMWYVAILMALSLAFSVWLYNEATTELRQSFEGPVTVWLGANYTIRTQNDLQDIIDAQITAGQQRVASRLVLLNLGVLTAGGMASYWLARRTLQPIQAALEAQKRFTADASHELRTPLAAIKTEVEVALRDPKLAKKDMVQLLRSNLEEIDRMSSLANNLLTLARSDSKPHLSAVQVSDVIKTVGKHLQPLANAKHITISYNLQPLKIMANARQTEVILGILLDNAIKYSPEHTTITILAQQDSGHCLITVSDQGYGITPQDLPHIFERFYRADSSRSKQHVPGHGLGLSIAAKLAVGLNANLTATSKLGKGSAFMLRVDLAQ